MKTFLASVERQLNFHGGNVPRFVYFRDEAKRLYSATLGMDGTVAAVHRCQEVERGGIKHTSISLKSERGQRIAAAVALWRKTAVQLSN